MEGKDLSCRDPWGKPEEGIVQGRKALKDLYIQKHRLWYYLDKRK